MFFSLQIYQHRNANYKAKARHKPTHELGVQFAQQNRPNPTTDEETKRQGDGK
jgi:hypothetical protein